MLAGCETSAGHRFPGGFFTFVEREEIAILRAQNAGVRQIAQVLSRSRANRGKSFLTKEVMIAARPAEADSRAVPGLWEGDLILGLGGVAIAQAIATLPATLRKSLTWDQGAQMAQNARLRIQLGLPIYFADPHSPWQRPSNEPTNGLLRQYFSKGTDFTRYSRVDLEGVAKNLNDRPRKTLSGSRRQPQRCTSYC